MEHFDWMQGFFIPYLNFGIFVFLLVYLARKPLIEMTQKRRQDYHSQMVAAKKAKTEAHEEFAKVKEKLDRLDQEIEVMRLAATKAVESEVAEIVSGAKRLADNILLEARNQGHAELDAVRKQLRFELVKAAEELAKDSLLNSKNVDSQRKEIQVRQVRALKSVPLKEAQT